MAKFLAEVRPDVPALREVVLFTEWDEFLRTAPDGVLPDVQPDDIAQIQYTSGTTGFPKGAELHHRGLTNNARFYARRIGLRQGEVYVNPMPMFHTSGCGMGVLGCVQSRAVHVAGAGVRPGAHARADGDGAVGGPRRGADHADRACWSIPTSARGTCRRCGSRCLAARRCRPGSSAGRGAARGAVQHRVRHDGMLAAVDEVRLDAPARQRAETSARRCRRPRSRSPTSPPATRRARRGRRAVRAWLPGHARIPRRARAHGPGDRRRRLVPHRRSRLDG